MKIIPNSKKFLYNSFRPLPFIANHLQDKLENAGEKADHEIDGMVAVIQMDCLMIDIEDELPDVLAKAYQKLQKIKNSELKEIAYVLGIRSSVPKVCIIATLHLRLKSIC